MDADIRFVVNDEPRIWRGDAMARLLDVLRHELGLTGTKEGCGEGECGSCTVWLDGEVVNACLVPMVQVDGRSVRTIEGLAATGALTPVQRAFVDEGAVQCGACTPGMVMTAEALLAREPHPTRDQVREHLAGNLCRCTGYQAIIRAVERASGGRAAERTPELTADATAGRQRTRSRR